MDCNPEYYEKKYGQDSAGKFQRHGQSETSRSAAEEETPVTGRMRRAVLNQIAAAATAARPMRRCSAPCR